MQDMLLMMKDTAVMRINFDYGAFEVLNQQLLPYRLQGAIRRVPDFDEIKSRYDDVRRQVAIRKNSEAVTAFLAGRVLPLTRDHAKKVYSLLHLDQAQDDYSKAKIALMCRAVSLQDNYWVKSESDPVVWKDVNIRTNHLNEIIAQVSLHGSSLSLQGRIEGNIFVSPEITGQGAYAKAWFRRDDGLWLYKAGAKDPTESRIEVMVSGLLDLCNVDHLQYLAAESNGIYCCRCRCMTTEQISILSAMDYHSYCIRNELDFDKECLRIDADSVYKMWIVDYLIANRDRHSMNWGFFIEAESNQILGCHPLYDHNNSFDIDFMQDEEADYQAVNGMTMAGAAQEAMKHVDFHFFREPVRADFITERQFRTFMGRAEKLGIGVSPD